MSIVALYVDGRRYVLEDSTSILSRAQPGARDAGALQAAPRRGRRHAVRAGDRGPRHRARRQRGGATARDGAPDLRRDRRLRRRARHRRPPALPPARRARRRSRRRPRAHRPRLPPRRERPPSAQRRRRARRARRAVGSRAARPRHRGARTGLPGGSEGLDAAVSPRGYRLLAKVPRLPATVVDRLVEHFGSLQKLLAANIDDLQASRVSASRAPARSARASRASPSPASSSATSDGSLPPAPARVAWELPRASATRRAARAHR
jgi:diadenylate cyclase